MRHRVVMRGTWLAWGVLALLASGCGEASSGEETVEPVARPTAVPTADGPVTTSRPVVVSDDGSGPHLCFGDILFGEPPDCDDGTVTGWDWGTLQDVSDRNGVRWGTYTLTGTFDGETFAVTEVSPPPGPEPYDFTIPCEEPADGWQVIDPVRAGQGELSDAISTAQTLDDYYSVAVSTPSGAPGPRDPAQTVISVYVAGDPAAAEATIRKDWGGMLCVAQVIRSAKEMEELQADFTDLPGVVQVGGNQLNQMEVEVFHDDGSIQRWADQEYGEDVVVVESNLQPVG